MITNVFDQRTVSVDKDGIVKVDGVDDLRGHTIKWRPVAKDLLRAEDGQEKIFAIRDGNGRVVRLAVDFPGVQVQRVSWHEDGRLVLPAVGASLGILVLVVLATLLRLGARIFLGKRPKPQPQPGTLWLTLGPRISAFAWVVLLGTILIFSLAEGDDLNPPDPDWFKWFVLMNWATGIAMFFSFFAIVAGIRIWWRDQIRWITMIKFSLVGLSCLILCWFAWHWNIIGPAHRI
jgi:hypothetical protein